MHPQFNDIRTLSYYENGNVFTGSIVKFRYRISKKDSSLTVCCWDTGVCYELAEIAAQEEYPLTDEGLTAVKQWLQGQYIK